MQNKAQPVRTRFVKTSLSEQAHEEIKKLILDQHLKPGDRLNIDALSRECGISSSPIREALIRLGSEGLVVFAANAGFSVAPLPDETKLQQIMEFRTMMEAHCARIGALKGDAGTIAGMEKACEEMAAMYKKGVTYKDYRQYIDVEQAFHQLIIDSAANQLISEAYRELHTVLLVARMTILPHSDNVSPVDVMDEHLAIVAAFRANDPDAAEAAVRQHLGKAKHRAEFAMQEHVVAE